MVSDYSLGDDDDVPVDTTIGTFSRISAGDFVFDEVSRDINITTQSCKIRVDGNDIANTYSTFKIFIYDATGLNDDDIDNGNFGRTLKTWQAMIINGNLYLDGFANGEFSKTGNYEYQISGINKTFTLPVGIDIDDILVRFGSDIGNLGNGIPEDYQMALSRPVVNSIKEQVSQSSKLKFDILENPTNNYIKYTVSFGTENYTTVNIQLFSIDGKLIKSVFKGDLSQISGVNQTVNISDLNSGVYYLKIITNTGEGFTRKVIIK